MTIRVFISYGREDSDTMRRVRDELQAAGMEVWTDEGIRPGSPSWKLEIETAIRGTDALVVLLSPDAAQSEWVRAELDFAQTLNKPIYPLLLRGDETNAVPFGLNTYQYIDLRRSHEVETGMRRLIAAITDYHTGKTGTPLPTTADVESRADTAGAPRRFALVVIALFVVLILGVGLVVAVIAAGETDDDPDDPATPTAQPVAAENPGEATPEVSANWTTYTGSGYTIDAPADWTSLTAEAYYETVLGTSLEGLGVTASDPNVTLDVVAIEPRSLSGMLVFVEERDAPMPNPVLRTRMEAIGAEAGFVTTRSEEVELPPGTVVRLEGEIQLEDMGLYRQLFYYPTRGSTIYWLIFFATETQFDRLRPDFEAAAQTFRFVDE